MSIRPLLVLGLVSIAPLASLMACTSLTSPPNPEEIATSTTTVTSAAADPGALSANAVRHPAAAGSSAAAAAPAAPDATVQIKTTAPGHGTGAKAGDNISVGYVGTLADGGKEFDRSKPGKPLPLKLGAGQVIKGWDQGLVGMKVGEKRRLTIPASLAYGARGVPPVIPPNSALVFDVTMEKDHPRSMKLPLAPRYAILLSVACGLLYFLAFAGVDIWPLAFVAFVPLIIAIEGQTPKRAFWFGVLAGGTMNLAGFYWLVNMLKTFSGFPTIACLFFASVVCAYQGGRIGLMTWLAARARDRHWPRAPILIAAFAASELLYPLLFPWYFAATVHNVSALTQTADLGGPILVGVMLLGVNLAISEFVFARLDGSKPNRNVLIGGAAGLAAALAYAAIRIHGVDAKCAAAEQVRVGIVQGNMGLMQKREDPSEGLRRHQRLTADLKKRGVDFVVWSESSVTFSVPEKQASNFMHDNVAGHAQIPLVFGAVLYRRDPDRTRYFNTALSTDERGRMTARYDKHYLLAFGEYLPLGDTFPILYEWSPNSGKFSSGDTLDPLLVQTATGNHKITMLVCYEDILPGFTRSAVNHADPELLVNMTNDAWFGNTLEPWQHLALAQFRAIEHRRYLVRGTNSGVSAVVDPVGRIIAKSHPFESEALDASVRWLHATTLYEITGDFPWYLLTVGAFAAAFVRRKNGAIDKSKSDVVPAEPKEPKPKEPRQVPKGDEHESKPDEAPPSDADANDIEEK